MLIIVFIRALKQFSDCFTQQKKGRFYLVVTDEYRFFDFLQNMYIVWQQEIAIYFLKHLVMILDLIQNHRKSFKIIIINLSISLSILVAMNNSNSIKEVIVNDEWFAEVQIGEYTLNCRIAGM